MITIVDYGMGNMGSISSMLRRSGHRTEITGEVEKIAKAEKLILPGVGAFDAGMEHLEQSGLKGVLMERAREVPVLGICLGMQLLFEGSDEGKKRGLGIFAGRFSKFTSKFEVDGGNQKRRIPHMGWSWLRVDGESQLLGDMQDDARFYFVHSYYLSSPPKGVDAVLWAEYGERFVCGVEKGHVFGMQFHPEKSHLHGVRLLSNFANL